MARPRVFDVDNAISIAMDLFWQHGYDRTSLSDLTDAMGITPPSFYHAFGSKEGLFEKVLERYQSEHLGFAANALAESTAREVVERLLHGLADAQSDPTHPPGCLSVNSVLPCADDADGVRRALLEVRCAKRARLRERFARAKAEGDLPADADLEALVRYVQTIGTGMAVEARTGATREELHQIVDMALSAWPPRTAKRPGPSLPGRQKRQRNPSKKAATDAA
jgi:AcrR family transcriptional regulator